jgi:small subunit ribosomal protein S9
MTTKDYNYAIWRRKETSAVIKLFPKGTGKFEIIIPGWIKKSLKDYFGWNIYLFENAIFPLTVLGAEHLNKFDMIAKTIWWWIAWQSDAIKLWLARSLIDYNPEFRVMLKPYWLLKRDPRIKERKKPWLKKARKRPKRSKR